MKFREKIYSWRFWGMVTRKLFVLTFIFFLGGLLGLDIIVQRLKDMRIISDIAYDIYSPKYNRSKEFLQNIRKLAHINLEKIVKDKTINWYVSQQGERTTFASTVENMKEKNIGIIFSSYPQIRNAWRRFYGGYIFTEPMFRPLLRVYMLQIFDENAESIFWGKYIGYDPELSQKNWEKCCFFRSGYNIPILEELFNSVQKIAAKE